MAVWRVIWTSHGVRSLDSLYELSDFSSSCVVTGWTDSYADIDNNSIEVSILVVIWQCKESSEPVAARGARTHWAGVWQPTRGIVTHQASPAHSESFQGGLPVCQLVSSYAVTRWTDDCNDMIITVMRHTVSTRIIADISHCVASCAQLGGTPYHSPKLHPGLCSSVGMGGRQTHRRTRPQCISFGYAYCEM